MNSVEIVATILGLIQGALIMFNKRINWVFYVIQMIALIVFSYQCKLYGDVLLNAIFVLFGVYGWFSWKSKRKDVTTTKDRWVVDAFIAFVVMICLYMWLCTTGDPLPLKDAFTTSFGFLATIYMVLRRLETWVIWFIVDITYVWQYAMLPQPAYLLVGLNVLWSFMAVGSFVVWFKEYKQKQLKRNSYEI